MLNCLPSQVDCGIVSWTALDCPRCPFRSMKSATSKAETDFEISAQDAMLPMMLVPGKRDESQIVKLGEISNGIIENSGIRKESVVKKLLLRIESHAYPGGKVLTSLYPRDINPRARHIQRSPLQFDAVLIDILFFHRSFDFS